MKKVFIGIDESYDNKKDGIFVLNFSIIYSEKDLALFESKIIKILHKYNLKEIKNAKISDELRKKIFTDIKEVEYFNLVMYKKIENMNKLQNIYTQSLLQGLQILLAKYRYDFYDIKIDNMGGETFQRKIIQQIRKTLKSENIEHSTRFISSERNYILQLADIFAGEYRKNVHKESSFENLLKKKNLYINTDFFPVNVHYFPFTETGTN